MRLLKEVTLYMDDKKKKFIAPEANMLDFANEVKEAHCFTSLVERKI